MPAARPETLIMREAKAMARDDRLRVTVRIGDMVVTVEPVDGGKANSDDPFAAVTYGKP